MTLSLFLDCLHVPHLPKENTLSAALRTFSNNKENSREILYKYVLSRPIFFISSNKQS